MAELEATNAGHASGSHLEGQPPNAKVCTPLIPAPLTHSGQRAAYVPAPFLRPKQRKIAGCVKVACPPLPRQTPDNRNAGVRRDASLDQIGHPPRRKQRRRPLLASDTLGIPPPWGGG